MTKKLRFLFCFSVFVACASTVSADSFGELTRNLNALMKSSKPATGTIPEGRELLPIIYGYTSAKFDDAKIGLLGIDIENKSFIFSQVSQFKGPLGVKMRQTSFVYVAEADGKFVVSTLKSSIKSKSAEERPLMSSTFTKMNKDFVTYFEKLFEMSDEDYNEFKEYAYSNVEIINAVVSRATNKLKAKKWLKDNAPEGHKTKVDFIVENIDESNKDGYAYKVTGIVYPPEGDSFTVNYYTNNEKYTDQKTKEFLTVEGIFEDVTFNEDFNKIDNATIVELQ